MEPKHQQQNLVLLTLLTLDKDEPKKIHIDNNANIFSTYSKDSCANQYG
jgi:hypothetical protein